MNNDYRRVKRVTNTISALTTVKLRLNRVIESTLISGDVYELNKYRLELDELTKLLLDIKAKL